MYPSMHAAPLTVTQPVTLEAIESSGAAATIQAELRYDAAHPYAVTTVFMTSRGRVRWTFSRDLLSEGLIAPCGEGDVHMWSCLDADRRPVMIIGLRSPEGEAFVQAKRADITRFLGRTHAIVAIGCELQHLNIDTAIGALLGAPLREDPFGTAPF
ncbi:MAG TPA: SsgA family sporulation/cell division regulator [Nocardioidaceae bacterium]|nr:SsgA family sporulation/cell division regulator [Nocardioidaceae bacterium]